MNMPETRKNLHSVKDKIQLPIIRGWRERKHNIPVDIRLKLWSTLDDLGFTDDIALIQQKVRSISTFILLLCVSLDALCINIHCGINTAHTLKANKFFLHLLSWLYRLILDLHWWEQDEHVYVLSFTVVFELGWRLILRRQDSLGWIHSTPRRCMHIKMVKTLRRLKICVLGWNFRRTGNAQDGR